MIARKLSFPQHPPVERKPSAPLPLAFRTVVEIAKKGSPVQIVGRWA